SEFVAKFSREAQAAASLSNPNVVGIYDVGQDGDLYYIVMENVEGKTLKQYIDDHAPLTNRQTVEMGMQIAEALRHAHSLGVVHRDIKPHNILVTKNGQLKVTDFGLAHATTTATVTQAGQIMGSVHYMSPEQARGGFIGAQSDIYSLGVVMYEMLTGTVPFTGDSMFSIALKHLQETPPSLRDINSSVMPRLEAIVLKAMSKEQANRYHSAEELLAELLDFSFSLEGTIEKQPSILSKTKDSDRETELQKTLMPRTSSVSGRGDNLPKKEPKAKKLSFVTLLPAFMILAMITTVAVFAYTLWPRPEVVVPNITGKSITDATALLGSVGLNYTLRGGEFSTEVPVEHVIRQDPPAGRTVRSGRQIIIVPSKGQEVVEVPDITGMTILQAKIVLSSRGFVLGNQILENHQTIMENVIISQNPRPPLKTQVGAQIDVVVSLGKNIVTVETPLLVGLLEAVGVQRIFEAGLSIGSITREISMHPSGTIILQSPIAGEPTSSGTPVSIVVSRGGRVSRTIAIPKEKIETPTRIEVYITEEGLSQNLVYDRVLSKAEEDLLISIEAFVPFRLVIRINGLIDRDEVISR
ncbi:MAG: Stk1 family PASTA domain-containing Ser/Thr kinase, partial [bacterium]|nr:Stk1 family PASTA domain-containing Ser/Thr kinase [bacterium]